MPPSTPDPLLVLSEERLDRIKAVFVDVRASLGLAWVGNLFETVAPFDVYLQAAWYQLKPSAVSAYFRRITHDIRGRAVAAARDSGLPFSDHRRVLAGALDEQNLHAVADLLDAIEAVHPASLLVATAMRDVLLGREIGTSPPRTGPDAATEDEPPREPLRLRPARRHSVEELRAAESGARSYLPFGTWPAYMDLVRREVRHLLRSDAYRRSQADMDVYASAAVRALPYPFRASGELAQSLGYSAGTIARLLDVVSEQQSRLCELTLQFGALRFAWEGGNLEPE